jgi:hypothetical protein
MQLLFTQKAGHFPEEGEAVNYEVVCEACGAAVWIRGEEEDDTNALELHVEDPNWDDACEHIKDGGSWKIGRSESCGDEDLG